MPTLEEILEEAKRQAEGSKDIGVSVEDIIAEASAIEPEGVDVADIIAEATAIQPEAAPNLEGLEKSQASVDLLEQPTAPVPAPLPTQDQESQDRLRRIIEAPPTVVPEPEAPKVGKFKFKTLPKGEDVGFKFTDEGLPVSPGPSSGGPFSKPEFAQDISKTLQLSTQQMIINQKAALAAQGLAPIEEVLREREALRQQARRDPVKTKSFLGKAFLGAMGMVPQIGGGIAQGKGVGITAGAVTAVAGQAGPQALTPEELVTVPTAVAAGTAIGALKFWYDQAWGSMYARSVERGHDDNVAKMTSAIAAVPYTAIERLQVGRIVPGFKNVFVNNVIKEVESKALPKIIGKFGKDWTRNVAEEGGQEIVDIIGERAAAAIDNTLNDKQFENAPLIEELRRVITTVKDVAGPMAFLMLPKGMIDAGGALKNLDVHHKEIENTFNDYDIRSQVHVNELASPIMQRISRDPVDSKDPMKRESFRARYIDRLIPIENVARELGVGEGNVDVTPVYRNARLFEGWAGKVEEFIETNTFNSKTLKSTGKALKTILKPLKGDKRLQANVSEYLVARHALDYHRRGIASGIKKPDAKVAIQKFGTDKIKGIVKGVDKYLDSVLQYAVDSDLISQEAKTAMQNKNRYYVPFYRVAESESAIGRFLGKTTASTPRVFKGKTGSDDLKIIDPLESVIKYTYAVINASERNKVALEIANLSQLPGSESFISKISSAKAIDVTADEVLSKLDVNDADVEATLQGLPDDIKSQVVSVFRRDPFTKTENVITVMDKGKPTDYQVDPLLYKAMASSSAKDISNVLKWLSFPAKLLRAGATLDPKFMGRNAFRDTMSMFFVSKAKARPFIDTFKGMLSSVMKDKDFQMFRRSGGEHSALVSIDREHLRQKLDDVLTGRFNLKGIVTSPLQAMQAVSMTLERASRLGEFKKMLKQFGYDPENIRDAGFAGREVTIDFQKKGYSEGLQALNKMTAFQNARIQGANKLVEETSKHPTRFLMRGMMGATIPSMMLWLINNDEEWYDDLHDWEKNLYWHYKIPYIEKTNGEPVILRIPKPFDAGLLFASVPERILDDVKKGNPKGTQDAVRQLIYGAAPIDVPTVSRPFIEKFANRSLFFDKPIDPPGSEGLDPEFRFNQSTSETAKLIGQITDVSPAQLENAFRGVTGGLGQLSLKLSDAAMRSVRTDLAEPPATSFTEKPIISAFFSRRPQPFPAPVKRFFDSAKEIERTRKSLNKARKIGQRSADRYSEKNAFDKFVMERTEAVVRIYKEVMSLKRDEIKRAKRGRGTPEEKRTIINQKNNEIAEAARKANKIIEDARKQAEEEGIKNSTFGF